MKSIEFVLRWSCDPRKGQGQWKWYRMVEVNGAFQHDSLRVMSNVKAFATQDGRTNGRPAAGAFQTLESGRKMCRSCIRKRSGTKDCGIGGTGSSDAHLRLSGSQAPEQPPGEEAGEAGQHAPSQQPGAARVERVLQHGPGRAQLLAHALCQLIGQDVHVGAGADERSYYTLRDHGLRSTDVHSRGRVDAAATSTAAGRRSSCRGCCRRRCCCIHGDRYARRTSSTSTSSDSISSFPSQSLL